MVCLVGKKEDIQWLVAEIEAIEMEMRQEGGRAMPRPPEIQAFIIMVKRIIS